MEPTFIRVRNMPTPEKRAFKRAQERADPSFPRDYPSFIDGWNAALAFKAEIHKPARGGDSRVMSMIMLALAAVLLLSAGTRWVFNIPPLSWTLAIAGVGFAFLYGMIRLWRKADRLDLEHTSEFQKRWN